MLWKLFCHLEIKTEQPQSAPDFSWKCFLMLVSLPVPALSYFSCPPLICESLDQFYTNWANCKKALRYWNVKSLRSVYNGWETLQHQLEQTILWSPHMWSTPGKTEAPASPLKSITREKWRDPGFISFAVHRLSHCVNTHEEVNIFIFSFLQRGGGRCLAVGILFLQKALPDSWSVMPEPFPMPS